MKKQAPISEKEMLNKIKPMLKAFFAAQFIYEADIQGPAWSEVTAGDIEAFSLEAINRVIDKFSIEEFNKEENNE